MYRRSVILVLFLSVLAACQQPTDGDETVVIVPSETAVPMIGLALETREPPTPAVVQVTPTPLPTATPTPTATPIIYAVQEGDTIWSIAYINRTVPDEVLATNPNVRPELLQVGQELVLPPPATPIYQTVAGTPVPVALNIKSLRLYTTPVDSVWVLGEVENLGDLTAENVAVEIVLYAADETVLETVRAWVVPGSIQPSARAPFGVLVSQVAEEPVRATALIAAGASVVNLGSRYAGLAISDSEVEIAAERITLRGMVQNNGDATATGIELVATLYDQAGSVTGFAQQRFDLTLAPTESQPFEFEMAPAGGLVTDYDLQVDALLLVEE